MHKILVVEDSHTSMMLTVFVLEKAGYKVIQASDAIEGIRLAHELLPELILMDIQLPGMDGMEATRQLKSDPATSHIPIIALTASAMSGDEQCIRESGCDGYLSKPLSYKTLLAAVNASGAIKKNS